MENLNELFLVAGMTGGASSAGTVLMLKVHINYLREAIARHELSLTRAHDRITEMQKGQA